MSRPTLRRIRMTAALLAGLVALTGCAGIPTGGPVGTAQLSSGDDGGDLVTIAEGPQPGASPEQLLANFLTAQRAPSGDYSVARLFLTDEFRTVWSPTERVLISNSPTTPTAVAEGSLRLTVNVQAFVNSTGNYSELAKPEAQSLDYEFAKNADGEWRIASAPAGILLSTTQFATTFGAYPLYFFEPSGAFLVPDVRWFPDTASRPERIVTELLAGQSTWYQNGVLVTAFPSGTKVQDVTIDSGTASVDLSSEVAAQPADARWRMQQQLVASLALGDVSSVQLTVGGLPIEVGSGTKPEWVLSVSSSPAGLADGSFGFLSAGGARSIPGISSTVEGLVPLGATLGRDATSAAVRTASGAWLVPADGDPALLDPRSGIVDPGLDVQGYLWSAVAADPHSIVAYAADGTPHPLSTPYLEGEIRALHVSRDGSRLLVGTQGDAGPAVTIVGIVRDADGVPVGLGEPLELVVGEAPLLDATWVDASTVAVLSQEGDETRVDLYRIGGRHESYGTVAQGVQLVGGNLADGLRVRGADGTVWRHSASGGWQSTGLVVSFLATLQ
ncbi:LpqB family beta-propeller domain-containing protein [Protaetiibacter intestinalis]|uniref:GerMN domain-containing protein n=1 Tax=Protaetiibacter intestinalis TaxID=2419774 RepID=A0A387B848_9MICO|nr:LpqB family beta-propeller domain-containing protein [Protaetiibacter intestinalis]AYF97159.1 hypothetical protein D7I47_02135 [Protaetiibacter intestinalis]